MVSLYRSPSQTQDQFNEFLLNFEQLLSDVFFCSPSFLLIRGDFNAKTSSWWRKDSTTSKGIQIEALTCSYGLSQLISSPTHILQNSSSCIDLIFTNQSNLVIDSGVHPSLHANCHHQITYSKLNLKIEYPPPYERLVWNYRNANSKAIKGFNWRNHFEAKILMHRHVSLIKLLRTFVTTIFQINMQRSMIRTHLG